MFKHYSTHTVTTTEMCRAFFLHLKLEQQMHLQEQAAPSPTSINPFTGAVNGFTGPLYESINENI